MRRHPTHTATFQERLADQARQLREPAKKTPGLECDQLMRKARQAETASHIDEWLSSPGLQAPG
jgi:hypothetical protein